MKIKICRCCGETYQALNGKTKYCLECRYMSEHERSQMMAERTRYSPRKRRKRFNSSLDKTLDEIRTYNKNHSKHLSYGEYISLKSMKKL